MAHPLYPPPLIKKIGQHTQNFSLPLQSNLRHVILTDMNTPNSTSYKYQLIADEYVSCLYTTEQIAQKYNISSRQVQRIVKALNVVRTISESNKLMAKYKDYSRHRSPNPIKRKTLPKAIRYKMIREHPFCTNCGNTPMQCPLQVDHIDGNPSNNDLLNLQVLCMDCNYGKK